MIKKVIKILLTIFLILILVISYLSIFGIKTNKLNNQITDNILKINKKINLSLGEVNYLLNPFNFTVNIKTKNPKISLEGRNLEIEDIQTNVALKSLINDQLSIDDLKIKTKKIKLKNIIASVRIFKNSPQLFVLDTIIKDGYVTVNINLNFDERGKVKDNYKINGSILGAKFNILNRFKLKNLNFNFDIANNTYLLDQIDMKLNSIKISSPLITIKKKKKSFLVNGQFLSDSKILNIDEFKPFFANLFKDISVQKIKFSSNNNFSFNFNKNLKFDNFKVESSIDLNQLIFNEKNFKLKSYLPSFIEEIKLEEHKIIINYNKNALNIKGSGNILLEDKLDNLSYEIVKDNNDFLFNSKINIKNNSLLIDFLDYEKKGGLSSSVILKGIYKENNQLRFDLINFKEKNNEISIKDLDLNQNFEIIDIENFNINYKNNKKFFNRLNLKKNNSNFIIEGESFDASSIINNIIDSDEESKSIFENLNSKISIRIKKTYIDDINYIDNLYGNINFNNNKINNLNLESSFPNKKKINLSIKTNNNSETITKLFTTYPKPLIKKYDYIKGFEE